MLLSSQTLETYHLLPELLRPREEGLSEQEMAIYDAFHQG